MIEMKEEKVIKQGKQLKSSILEVGEATRTKNIYMKELGDDGKQYEFMDTEFHGDEKENRCKREEKVKKRISRILFLKDTRHELCTQQFNCWAFMLCIICLEEQFLNPFFSPFPIPSYFRSSTFCI